MEGSIVYLYQALANDRDTLRKEASEKLRIANTLCGNIRLEYKDAAMRCQKRIKELDLRIEGLVNKVNIDSLQS